MKNTKTYEGGEGSESFVLMVSDKAISIYFNDELSKVTADFIESQGFKEEEHFACCYDMKFKPGVVEAISAYFGGLIEQ